MPWTAFMMPTIMVIEDDPATRKLVSLILSELPYDTVTFPDAESAWDRIAEVKPTLAVVDVRLPGMSGVKFVEMVKQDPALATPVVLMSAQQEPEQHEADVFCAKPFDPEQLLEVVRDLTVKAGGTPVEG
jgi:CheY-like chemotaxis protein